MGLPTNGDSITRGCDVTILDLLEGLTGLCPTNKLEVDGKLVNFSWLGSQVNELLQDETRLQIT